MVTEPRAQIGPAPSALPPSADAGELPPAELAYRFGLLLGAALFLIEGAGAPWSRSPFVFGASLVLSILIVLTMTLQWRVLGDWRRFTQRLVLAALPLVLAIPLTAALSPSLGSSALPAPIEAALQEVFALLSRIPGLGVALELLRGLIVFIIYVLVLFVLLVTSGPNRRAGFVLLAGAVIAVTLFFYPTAETIVGLVFLGLFFSAQWERPLLVPDRIRPHLSPVQLSFLRELVDQGALSTGETKLYLDQDASSFGQLLDLRLVEYDSIAREVLPGARLGRDSAGDTFNRVLFWARRAAWLLAGIAYFLLPDLIPGPIDDLIILALCGGGGFGFLGTLFGGRRSSAPRP